MISSGCRQAQGAPAPAGKAGPKAQSVIHIFLPGGMAQQESFDPKPYAPVEYRGEMGVINTKLDGVQFNECLKQTAQVADQITVVRAMTHGEAAHERGTHNMFTGYRPSPAITFPSMGSVVSPTSWACGTTCRPMWPCRACRPTSPAPATSRAPTAPLASGPTRPMGTSACRIWRCPTA